MPADLADLAGRVKKSMAKATQAFQNQAFQIQRASTTASSRLMTRASTRPGWAFHSDCHIPIESPSRPEVPSSPNATAGPHPGEDDGRRIPEAAMTTRPRDIHHTEGAPATPQIWWPCRLEKAVCSDKRTTCVRADGRKGYILTYLSQRSSQTEHAATTRMML